MGELTGLRISLAARTPGAGEEGGSSHEVGRLGAAAPGSASTGDRSLGLLEGGFRVCVREAPGALPLPSLMCTCCRPSQTLLSLRGSLSQDKDGKLPTETHGQKLNHYRLQVMKSVF